jgi:lipoyl-dependent peroxiredoxin
MNRLEKVLYTAKAHTTGGRDGMSRSSDGCLEVRLSRPGGAGTGTNPEQLFAAGWSACFESAMEFAARNMKITLPADHAVDAEIDLGPEGGAFSLAARLYVSLPGMERATAQRLARSNPKWRSVGADQVERWAGPIRACLHSPCPEDGGDEVDDGGEAFVGLLVARGNASEGF